MMNATTIGGFGYSLIFHKLFALAFLLGLIFFIVWAIKNLKKDQLRNWAIGLLAVGLIGLLITASSGYGAHGKFGKYSKSKSGFDKTMFSCMQDEECQAEMESVMDRMMESE